MGAKGLLPRVQEDRDDTAQVRPRPEAFLPGGHKEGAQPQDQIGVKRFCLPQEKNFFDITLCYLSKALFNLSGL